MITRRTFLRQSLQRGLSLTGLALITAPATRAIPPFQRTGSPRLLLSLAAYSFRDYFRDSTHRQTTDAARGRALDLFQFIDYCAEHRCQGAELTSYYFPQPVTEELLLRLKRHAFLKGISISGTAVGNTFTLPSGPKRATEIANVKRWIDYAQVMGAPHIRVFAGAAQGLPKAEARKLALDAMQECCAYAAGKGVMLGLENHGGIVTEPEDLLDLVRAVDSPWFGVNLDTGNFHTDDPYRDLALCAPYAVNVQVKSEIQRRGHKKEAADLARLIQMLREANYQGYVALEYEAAPDPWEAVPPLLAQMRPLMKAAEA